MEETYVCNTSHTTRNSFLWLCIFCLTLLWFCLLSFGLQSIYWKPKFIYFSSFIRAERVDFLCEIDSMIFVSINLVAAIPFYCFNFFTHFFSLSFILSFPLTILWVCVVILSWTWLCTQQTSINTEQTNVAVHFSIKKIDREREESAFYILRQNWTNKNTQQHIFNIHLKHEHEKNVMGFVCVLHTANCKYVCCFFCHHTLDLVYNVVKFCWCYVKHTQSERDRRKRKKEKTKSFAKRQRRRDLHSINCLGYGPNFIECKCIFCFVMSVWERAICFLIGVTILLNFAYHILCFGMMTVKREHTRGNNETLHD